MNIKRTLTGVTTRPSQISTNNGQKKETVMGRVEQSLDTIESGLSQVTDSVVSSATFLGRSSVDTSFGGAIAGALPLVGGLTNTFSATRVGQHKDVAEKYPHVQTATEVVGYLGTTANFMASFGMLANLASGKPVVGPFIAGGLAISAAAGALSPAVYNTAVS